MSASLATTSDRFKHACLQLLSQGGLAAAGINEVVAQSNAPRGSLYYCFPAGKAQMVQASLLMYQEQVSTRWQPVLGSQASWQKKVIALFDLSAQRARASGFANSCAVGTVLADLSATDQALRTVCQAVLGAWQTQIAQGLDDLRPAQQKAAAQYIVQSIQGAYLLARATHSQQPFKIASRAAVIYIEAL
jgi:TetR/AcrR family transcriptional regulator, lmrAB and yxaGH operons repressor